MSVTDLHPRNGQAHVIGSPSPELWRRTIPDVVASTVSEFSLREAVVFIEQGVR